MILETDIFEMWMGKIMERFDRHERLLASLTGKEVKEIKYLDGERLLDGTETAAAAYPPLNFAGHRQDAII